MTAKLEQMVKKQSKLLAEKMPNLIKVASGQFVAFLDNEYIIKNSHKECFEAAVKEFGPTTGFVIDEVSSRVPVLSAIVKLK